LVQNYETDFNTVAAEVEKFRSLNLPHNII